MTSPTPSACNFDFFISNVYKGNLNELGAISDAHQTTSKITEAINKLNSDVAVFEISYKTSGNLSGFKFKMPLAELGLPTDAKILSVVGGFDGTNGDAKTKVFRLYHNNGCVYGLSDPMVTNLVYLSSSSSIVLCYVVVGGKNCNVTSAVVSPLEEVSATTDTFLDANADWFLYDDQSNFWFESELFNALRLSSSGKYENRYSASGEQGFLNLSDVVSIAVKSHKSYNSLKSNAVVPKIACAEAIAGEIADVKVSCVTSFPSHQRGKFRTLGEDGCPVVTYSETDDYASSKDVAILMGSELEPHDFNVKFSVTSNRPFAGVQFDIGYNYYSNADRSKQSIKINSALNGEWFHKFASIRDRFGFDQVTRIVAFQKPVDVNEHLADIVHSKEEMARLLQKNSMPAVENLDFLNFSITDCLPEGCPTPEVVYKFKEDSRIASNQSVSAGDRYYGSVVYYQGDYWTASSNQWTPGSVKLEKSWDGIEIFNVRIVSNDSRELLEHVEQDLTYKGKELFYSQTIDTDDYKGYLDYYEHAFNNYITKALYNGLNSNPSISSYSYLSTTGGFDLDSNLDGKFDVADLVALSNLAQMRMAMPFNSGTFDGASAKNTSLKDGSLPHASTDDSSFWNVLDFNSPLVNSRELDRIVPSYVQNKGFRTSTYPHICPTVSSLEDQDSKSMIYLSQRTDIKPDKAAEAVIAFRGVGVDGETITLVDWDGVSKTYEFDSGGGVSGSNIAVTIAASAADQATNFKNAVDGEGTHGTSIDTAISSTEVTLTSYKIGDRGNTSITYSTGALAFLSKFPNSFTRGSNYLSTLPLEFKDWYRYQKDVLSIPYTSAQDVRSMTNGGTFMEVKLSTAKKEMNFIENVKFTLNICSAYKLVGDTPVSAKIFLSDAFASFDVFKQDGSTPISASADGSYFIPIEGDASEGKIQFVCKIGSGSSSVEDKAAAITAHGGAFKVATVLLNREIETLKGESVRIYAASVDYRKRPRGLFDNSIGKLIPSVTTDSDTSGPLELGPISGIMSQSYADNSSSIHTYSDYVLHVKASGPNVIDIIYNSDKHFRRFNFAFKTWNDAEVQSIMSSVGVKSQTGWKIYSKTSTDSNGETVILISGFSDAYAEPRNLVGSGILCRLLMDRQVFENSILSNGSSLVCPPLGISNDVVIPDLDRAHAGEKDYPTNWKASDEETIFNNQGVSHRFSTQPNDKSLIQLLDAKKVYSDSVSVDASSKVTKWIGQGLDLVPHAADSTYAPTRAADHILFSGAQGLTSHSDVYTRTKNITTWMASVVVEPLMPDSADQGIVFTTIGSNVGTTQPQIKLTFDTTSNGSLVAKCVTTSGGTITITHNYASLAALRTKQLITFTGVAGGDCKLYVNGTLAGTDVSNSISTSLTDHDFGWALGYDGSGVPANGTEAFDGKIYEFLFHADSVTDSFRETTEAYLALKFELQAQLPTTHTGYNDGSGSYTYVSLRNNDPESRLAIEEFEEKTTSDRSRSTKCSAKWVSNRACIDKEISYLFNASEEPAGGGFG